MTAATVPSSHWTLHEPCRRRGRPFTDAPELWLLDGAPAPDWRAPDELPTFSGPVRRRWSVPVRLVAPSAPAATRRVPTPSTVSGPPLVVAGPAAVAASTARAHPMGERREPGPAERMRLALRARHYSCRTEKAYLGWLRRFASYHRGRSLEEMGREEVAAYLAMLATRDHVAASTQNQAFSALLFFYRDVLEREIPGLDDVVRAKRPLRVPLVLAPEEVRAVLCRIRGTPRIMAALMYGSGLRLLECCRLRVKDVDFFRREVTVRDGKGRKDRVTVLPDAMVERLQVHLERVHRLHQADIAAGAGAVLLPDALDRKYVEASLEWPWQWVFPAARLYTDVETGARRRHHIHESAVQREFAASVRAAGLTKAGYLPQPATLVRHAAARERLRHPHDPGAPRPRRRQHHDDLHPRPEPRRPWRPKPPRGRAVTARPSLRAIPHFLRDNSPSPSRTCPPPQT